MTCLELAVQECVAPGLKELDNIWEYIGYGDDLRAAKLQTLADSLQRCLLDFLAAENQQRVDLESRVDSLKRKAAQVCQSLRLPQYYPPRGLPTLQLLARLQEHIAQYEVEIGARQEKFSEIASGIAGLCRSLGLNLDAEMRDLPAAGDRPDEFIPSEQDLERMTRRLGQLQLRHDELMKLFVGFCEDIRRIATDIEYLPETELEAAVLRPRGGGGDISGWPLTQGSLDQLQSWRLRLVKHKAMLLGTCDELRSQLSQLTRRLRLPEAADFLARHRGYRPSDMTALRDELAHCQELRRSSLAAVYSQSLRAEASELAALCFEETDLGGSLDALETQVDRLRNRYERSRELYDSVRQYQLTWEAYMEVEQRMKDPAIFSNRGGILLKTEKEKKQLAKELPRVEARVAEQLRACPGGQGFTIRGLTFQQYVAHLWEEFRSEKEAAKFNRRLSRASIVGSSSSQDLAGGSNSSVAMASSSRKSIAPVPCVAASSKR